jgi:hypothetical protein
MSDLWLDTRLLEVIADARVKIDRLCHEHVDPLFVVIDRRTLRAGYAGTMTEVLGLPVVYADLPDGISVAVAS